MNITFKVADIRFSNGQLVIDTTGVSMSGKHYHVTIEEHESWVRVTGNKPSWGMALHSGEYDISEITDDSIEEYKPWPWSKTKKKRSKNIVEFKKQTKRTYTSDNWQLIRN